MKKFMIVTVKYTNNYIKMSTGLFSYTGFMGEIGNKDTLTLVKDHAKYDWFVEQAIDKLKKDGHNVVGTDQSNEGVDYIIVGASEDGFKPIGEKL